MDEWKEELLKFPGRQEEAEWLRERLEVLSEKENTLLAAAIQRRPPGSAADVVECVLSLDGYEVCAGAGCYETLAEYALEYDDEWAVPKEAFPYIGVETLGEAYEYQHPGLFIGNDYVVYPKQEMKALRYDGIHLPEEDYSWSLRLKLASESRPEGVWLRLPDYEDAMDGRPDEVKIAFRELGVKTNSECTLLDARCSLPGIGGLMEYNDLAALIYDGQNLGFLLNERGQGQEGYLDRFLAALELEKCSRLDEAVRIGGCLSQYRFIRTDGVEQFAEARLQSEGYRIDRVKQYMDLRKYGEALLAQEGFQLNEARGLYLRRKEQTMTQQHISAPSRSMIMQ